MREHPGRLNTKSAPNALNGVTKPSAIGCEMTLDEISKALFAVKSYGSGVVNLALIDRPDQSIVSAKIVLEWPALSALLGPSGKPLTTAANPRCPIRLRNNGRSS